MSNTHGRFSPNTREFSVCIHCEKRLCKVCNKNLAPSAGKGKNGNVYYRPECKTCENLRVGRVDTRTSREKKPWNRLSLQIRQEVGKCEECQFVPKHLGQLDVDHIDGNPKNNDRSNLKVLCANCHRLKTIEGTDWVKTMNIRYQENTGDRRPNPTEYMRLKRAKQNLEGLTPEIYRGLTRKEKISKIRSLCNFIETKEILRV